MININVIYISNEDLLFKSRCRIINPTHAQSCACTVMCMHRPVPAPSYRDSHVPATFCCTVLIP